MANYSLNFDFGNCRVGPLGRGKKKLTKLQMMLGDDPFENSVLEHMSLVNKAIFQAPAPSYSKRCAPPPSRRKKGAKRALGVPTQIPPARARPLTLSPPPRPPLHPFPSSVHPWSPADCVYLDSMTGYHFPAVLIRCKRAPAVRTIVHCHANACDIGHIYELCQRDAECWQANVLLVEYPGYGTSPGNPYERSVDRHVMIAYEYLVSELRCKPESIILFGRSLGSGPVCRLALRLQELGERVGGVILHSPFISVKEVGLSLLGGVANIITDRWDNRKPLAAIACRTLIIHGASDEVVPFAHAEALRDVRKANGLHVTFFPTQGTHNYFSYYRDYLNPVENFLAGHTSTRAPQLPDPLPLARYSRAQVREIMELRRKRSTATMSSSSTISESTAIGDAAGEGAVDRGQSRGGKRGYSPISTLVDGAGPASDPTSSDEDELAEEPRLAAAAEEEHPRQKWSRGRGRGVSGGLATSTAATRGRAGGDRIWDDDDVVTSVPSGASPFGAKTKPPSAVTAR